MSCKVEGASPRDRGELGTYISAAGMFVNCCFAALLPCCLALGEPFKDVDRSGVCRTHNLAEDLYGFYVEESEVAILYVQKCTKQSRENKKEGS